MNFLFPPSCIGCGKEGNTICARCIALTRKSLSSPAQYVVAAFDYRDPLIKKSIHRAKYYGRKDLIPPLAGELAQEAKALPLNPSSILVPVPMPRFRKLLRGYNQAELIARELSPLLSISVREELLVRIRNPKRQVEAKTKEERLKNQLGTFGVLGDIHGLDILLVDDVITTGATLEAARKILLQKGARSVQALTLAH